MEDFPTEYDVIVLGTGLPESVVAAALSRIGHKVLHLDRNDYYSSQWATFTFDGLLKWIDGNQCQAPENSSEVQEYAGELGPVEQLAPVPQKANVISNIAVKSYFRTKRKGEASNVTQKSIGNTGPLPDTEPKTEESQGQDAETPKTEERTDRQTCDEETEKVQEQTEAEGQVSGSSADEVSTEGNQSPFQPQEAVTEPEELLPSFDPTPYSIIRAEAQASGSTVYEASTEGESPPQSQEAVPEPEEVLPSIEPTPMSRRQRITKPPVGCDMTFEDLEHYYRHFNIDLAPKVLLSRGTMVESLITANISHYAEFKVVNHILTYLNNQIEDVPCSRSDVFSSSLISVIEKRMLMKFLTFCVEYELHSEEYMDFKDKPYVEFLQSRRMTPNLQHFVLHAIAMVHPDTPTIDGLVATQSFLQSLGRYGNTPFIWPLYGIGELPQAFCRMCAVFGGLYCLRRSADSLIVDSDSQKCTGVISDGQKLKCKWLVMEHTYLPSKWKETSVSSVSRAVFITDKSIKVSEEDSVTLLAMPSQGGNGIPVRILELGHSTMACPRGLHVVHLISEGGNSAQEDLEATARELLHFPSNDDDREGNKPVVLWSLYFNHAAPGPWCVKSVPQNVLTTSLPGISLNLEQAMQQAKDIFVTICGPAEEFLPAVPNPEDIIMDDFLSAGNDEGNAGIGGANDSNTVNTGDSTGADTTSSDRDTAGTNAVDSSDRDTNNAGADTGDSIGADIDCTASSDRDNVGTDAGDSATAVIDSTTSNADTSSSETN